MIKIAEKFCHNSSVRRFFALVLLVLLPLQFVVAAAAPYCAFEMVTVASHFGHHEHPDAPAPEPTDDRGDQGKLDDCGVCHLGCGQIHTTAASHGAVPAEAPVSSLPDERQPQHLQEPSERPPRISLT